jgi:hypothetical protein
MIRAPDLLAAYRTTLNIATVGTSAVRREGAYVTVKPACYLRLVSRNVSNLAWRRRMTGEHMTARYVVPGGCRGLMLGCWN